MYDTSGDNQAKIEATTDLTKLNCNAPFVNNSNLKSIIIQNNTQKCNHGDYFLGKNKFCKKCGIYIIEGVETYREPCYENSGKIDSNTEYSLMIKKQSNNRLFNPKSLSLQYRERLISYIRSKSQELQFSSLTTYSAISYMDSVLS